MSVGQCTQCVRAVAISSLLCVGCEIASFDGDRFRMIRTGDTLMVSNTRPLHGDTAWLELQTRYGMFDGAAEYVLGKVLAVAVGPNAEVYAFDPSQGVIQFGANGRFVELVARKGSGPGEVRAVEAITVASDGTLAIFDYGNRRVTVYSPAGDLRTLHMPRGLIRRGEDALQFFDNGDLWVGINPNFDAAGVIDFPRPSFARFTTDGELVDTIFISNPYDEGCANLSHVQYAAGFWEDKREPFIPKLVWSLGRDGSVAVGCPANYEFSMRRPDGTVVVISRLWDPWPVPEEVRAFFMQWGGVPDVPATRPAYARIVMPGDGRIWVWPNKPAERVLVEPEVAAATGVEYRWQLAETGAFDVFSYDGEWIGSVLLPKELQYSGFPNEPPLVIRGDTIWGVTVDSLGVETVGRFRVQWPSS